VRCSFINRSDIERVDHRHQQFAAFNAQRHYPQAYGNVRWNTRGCIVS
jgi:hypothetical protein